MRSFITAFAQYNMPSRYETLGLLITAFFAGFIFSFDRWGNEVFDLVSGVTNLILFTCFAFLLLLAFELGRRMWATRFGYQIQYKVWWAGILVGVFLVFFTQGFVKIIFPGGYVVRELSHLRIGSWQYHLRVVDLAKISIAGVIAGVILVVLLNPIMPWPIVVMNMFIIIGSLVPLDIFFKPEDRSTPHSPGTTIIISSRTKYVLTFCFVILSFLFMRWLTPLLALLVAFVLSALLTLAYFIKRELK